MSAYYWQLCGWTMLHFLWIGSFIALLFAIVRLALRRTSANVRYAATLVGFALLAASPLAIGSWLHAYGEFINPTTPAAIAAASETVGEPARLTGVSPPPSDSVTTPQPAVEVIDLKHNPIVLPIENAAEPEPAPVAPAAEASFEPVAEPEPFAAWDPLAMLRLATHYLPWLWLVGTPLTFLLLATGLVGSERLRRQATILTEGPVCDAAARLRESLGIARQVSVAVSDRVMQPVLLGIVRPLVLLPSAAVTGWSPAEIEMALVHELAHVRGWDNLVNFVQRVVEALLFFHPAVWLMSRWLREGREQRCDAVVVSECGDREGYAELLIAVARTTSDRRLPSMAVAMAQHPLARRVRRILQLEDDPMLVSKRTVLLVAALFIAITAAAFWSTSSADEPIGEPEAASTATEEAVDDATTEDTESAEEVADRDAVAKLGLSPGTEVIELLQQFKAEGRNFRLGTMEGKFTLFASGHSQVNPPEELTESEAESLLWKLVFADKRSNPIEKQSYDVTADFGRNSDHPLGAILDALRKDPFGPKVDFGWRWVDDNRIELEAPRHAHWLLRPLLESYSGLNASIGPGEERTTEDTESAEDSTRIVLHPNLTEEELLDIRNQLAAGDTGFTISIDGPFAFLRTKDGVVKATRIEIDGDQWRVVPTDGTSVPGAADAMLVAEFLEFPAKVVGQLLIATAKTLEPRGYAIEVSQHGRRSLRLTAWEKGKPGHKTNFSSQGEAYDFTFKADTPFEGLRELVAMYEETGHNVKILRKDNHFEMLALEEPDTETANTDTEDTESAEDSTEIDTTINGTSKTYHFAIDSPMSEIQAVLAAHEKAGHQVKIKRDGDEAVVIVTPKPAAAADAKTAADEDKWPVKFDINMSPMVMQAQAIELAKRGKDFKSSRTVENYMQIHYEGLTLVCKEIEVYPDRIVARDGTEVVELSVNKRQDVDLPFLPLEDQRVADLAYRMLSVEIARLDDQQLEAVKKNGFAGGVRVDQVVASTYGSVGQAGDILVGLHVWPTASFEQLGEVLRRDDLDQFNPLKYYMLRKQVDPEWEREQLHQQRVRQTEREQQRVREGRSPFEAVDPDEAGAEEQPAPQPRYVWKLQTGRVHFNPSAWEEEQNRLKRTANNEEGGRAFTQVAPGVAVPIDMSEEDKQKIIESRQPKLLYDGRTFDQWRDEWKTELKTEKRTEAIQALRAFGRAGYGKQATEAILDVADEYDMSWIGSDRSPQASLETAIAHSFVQINQSNPIPTDVALPAMLDWYDAKHDNRRMLTTWVLCMSDSTDADLQKRVAALAKEGPTDIRMAALQHLVQSDPSLETDLVREVVKSQLADDDNTVAINALRWLTNLRRIPPRQETRGSKLRSWMPEMLPLLFHENLSVRQEARWTLIASNEKQLGDLPTELAKLITDPATVMILDGQQVFEPSDDAEVLKFRRLAGIRALAVLGQRAKAASAELEAIFDSDDQKLRIAAIVALCEIYSADLLRESVSSLPESVHKKALELFNLNFSSPTDASGQRKQMEAMNRFGEWRKAEIGTYF